MYSYSFPVRYYEADPMGIVHHSEYVRYFECCRNNWLDACGYGVAECAADDIVFPVARLDMRYKYSARFGDVVTVTTEIEEFTGARITMHQQVLNGDGKVCVDGHITLGFMNSKTGMVMRCPEKLTAIIEKELNKQ